MSKNTKRATVSGNAGIDALTIDPNVRDIPAIDATIDDTLAELEPATVEPIETIETPVLETEAPAIHEHIDAVIAQIKASAIDTEEPKIKVKKAKEPKASVATIKYDLPTILAAIPDEFTPAMLDKAFGLNDGGKTVRRHLRNHFAEEMEHNKKDKWGFTKSTCTAIIEYFASRYAFNADALKG